MPAVAIIRLFIMLGVAVKSTFEFYTSNDEASPAIDKAKLENVVIDKSPNAVAKCARH
ncbi:MAG: hypothetical protein WA322_05250 [Pseudolabrys sp.]